jgi:hypothetical protein
MKTMQQKVNEFIVGAFGAGALLVVIVLLAILAPAIFIFTINELAEAGGADFRIEHGLWNYFMAFLFLIAVRGVGSGSKS